MSYRMYTTQGYSSLKIIMERMQSADFHLDPSKQGDPVESLLEKKGAEDAFDELMSKLEQNPNDEEARRQANLLVNRLEDLVSRLREKTQH